MGGIVKFLYSPGRDYEMSSRFFEFPGRELFWRHRRDLRNTLIWVFLFSINPLTSSCGMQEKEAPRDLDISILVDRSKNRSFSSIEKERRLWSPTKRRMRTSDWNTYPVWVRIEAKEPLEPGDYTLELSYPGLERVVFFLFRWNTDSSKNGRTEIPFFSTGQ